MNLLSIQSHVAYGHVGNSAAVFPLQRLGVEVWAVDTVQYSNHTRYETWRGRVFEADLIREIVRGIEERGVLGECDGVLSGYMGSAEIGGAILDAVGSVKRANPAARYCCDPVIGDVDRGVFVHSGIPEFMKNQVVPAADVLTPNQFELDYLSGGLSATMADAVAAVAAVRALGPRVVFVTSLRTDDTPDDSIDLLGADEDGTFLVRTPLLPIVPNGAGDAIAGLLLMHLLHTGSVAETLSRAASSMFGILNRTCEEGAGEILLVTAQDELVSPSEVFPAQPVKL
jgi:pyridoxine kinase